MLLTFQEFVLYHLLYEIFQKNQRNTSKICKIKISFIYTFHAITGTPGVTTSVFNPLKSWAGITATGGGSSSFGSTTLTLSGNGFLGPFLPEGSHGNIILTLIPKTPASKFQGKSVIIQGKIFGDYINPKIKIGILLLDTLS